MAAVSFQDRMRFALADDAPGRHRLTAKSALTGYLSRYDGAKFDTYRRAAESEIGIQPSDLVAVTFLSMEIRRGTRSGFTPAMAVAIENRRDDITMLLQEIPADAQLHSLNPVEFERLAGEGSYGERIWHILRNDIRVPRVATYKLMARVRPHLFPIRDSAADRALGQGPSWWRPWWESLSTGTDIVARLRELRAELGRDDLSLLRVADIVIWMRFREPSQT